MNSNNPARNLENRLSQLKPHYKSQQEAEIGRMLDSYGIPFFYNQPAVVFDRGQYKAVRPAFTLPGYGGLALEYSDNEAEMGLKKRLYDSNAIPAVITSKQDLRGFKGPANLFKRIDRAIEQYRMFMKNPARSEVQPSDYIHPAGYQ